MTLQEQKNIISLYKKYTSTDKKVIANNLYYYITNSSHKAQIIAEATSISIHTIYQLRKASNKTYTPDFIVSLIICDFLSITVSQLLTPITEAKNTITETL